MWTLGQHKDWLTSNSQGETDSPESVEIISDEPSDLEIEAWDKTDRQFRFPAWQHSIHRRMEGLSPQEPINPARTRWLEENDVHTQFFDAGIACCWFAQLGDHEPVTGETEDEAITRLAQEHGLALWR